jgi:hypothetical protein
MNPFSIFVFAALLDLAFAASANAGSEQSFNDERSFGGERPFVGLWEGIDPTDGGDALRSITCAKDQTCNLAPTDTVISLCGSGTGFAAGTGGLEGDELVSRTSCSPVRTAKRRIWSSATNATSSTGRSWKRPWSATGRCRTSSFTR